MAVTGDTSLSNTTEVVVSKIRNTCPQCGVVEEFTVEVNAFVADLFDSGETAHICDACSNAAREIEWKENEIKRRMEFISDTGIPPEFRVWDKSKGNQDVAHIIRDNRNKSLFISGRNGTCKTRAAAYNLYIEAKLSGRKVRFIRFSELAAQYAAICKRESEQSFDFIMQLLDVDILLIDDIGKRRITENAGEMLFEMVDRIYAGDSKALLWFTGNTGTQELASMFAVGDTGDSIVSRFDRMIADGRMAAISTDNNLQTGGASLPRQGNT